MIKNHPMIGQYYSCISFFQDEFREEEKRKWDRKGSICQVCLNDFFSNANTLNKVNFTNLNCQSLDIRISHCKIIYNIVDCFMQI